MTAHWEDDQEAMTFLRARGYRLNRAYDWTTPADHEPTELEKSAAQYLFEEWDFGGIIPYEIKPVSPAQEATNVAFAKWIRHKLIVGRISEIGEEFDRMRAALKLAREFVTGQQIEHALVLNDDGSFSDLTLGKFLDRAISAAGR